MTDHESLNSDRRLAPRGYTPLRDLPDSESIPDIYKDRLKEYEDLLRRGATREMCEQFLLEYTHEKGIVAWADDDI